MTDHEVSAQLLSASLELSEDMLEQVADLVIERVRERLGDPVPEPIAYTVDGLAHALGVSAKVVRGAIHRGDLQPARRAGRYLITADAARAWATPVGPASRRTKHRACAPTAHGGRCVRPSQTSRGMIGAERRCAMCGGSMEKRRRDTPATARARVALRRRACAGSRQGRRSTASRALLTVRRDVGDSRARRTAGSVRRYAGLRRRRRRGLNSQTARWPRALSAYIAFPVSGSSPAASSSLIRSARSHAGRARDSSMLRSQHTNSRRVPLLPSTASSRSRSVRSGRSNRLLVRGGSGPGVCIRAGPLMLGTRQFPERSTAMSPIRGATRQHPTQPP
jgi:hypothetical protein